ncbi:hypothetical protein ACNS7O_00005 [Haloferacaceae archaeon DSL9]
MVPKQGGDEAGVHVFRDAAAYTDALRRVSPDHRIVAVLHEHTIPEWRRFWRTEIGWSPPQQAYIEATELSRSATASEISTHTTSDQRMAVTHIERPVSATTLVDVALQYVAGWDAVGLEVTVCFDGIDAVIEDDADGYKSALNTFQTALVEMNAAAYLNPGPLPISDEVRDLAATYGAVASDTSARIDARLSALKQDDPTNYGYVKRYWREARQSIEACDRNYPLSRQLHRCLETPRTTPRTLGATLQALVSLGVIDRWGDTIGPTRYDLTSYDSSYMDAVGEALDDAP